MRKPTTVLSPARGEDGFRSILSVLKLPGRGFRMWYCPFDSAYAIAESTDGLRWHRPSMQLVRNVTIYSRWQVKAGLGDRIKVGEASNLLAIGLGR